MKKKFLIVPLLMVFCSLFIMGQNTAFAVDDTEKTGKLSLSPSVSRLGTLEPGETYTNTINVFNGGSRGLKFSLSPTQFSLKDNSSYEYTYGVSDSQYGKIASWTNLDSKKIYSIAAGESKAVKYTIFVPEDQPGGAQHMMISAKIIDDNAPTTDVQAETIINLQVYSNIDGNLYPAAKLISQNIIPFSFNPVVRTSSSIENTGNADISAQYKLKVMNVFSGALAYENIVEKDIIVDSKRVVEQAWGEAPQLGIFKVHQEIEYVNENGSQTVADIEKLVFICPIWFIVILVIVIALVIIYFCSMRQKHKSSKISLG